MSRKNVIVIQTGFITHALYNYYYKDQWQRTRKYFDFIHIMISVMQQAIWLLYRIK